MPDTTTSKDELRRSLRQRRSDIAPSLRIEAARAAAGHLSSLPHWGACQQLGLYYPGEEEFDCMPMAELARNRGVELYLPVIGEDMALTFAHWAADARLQSNRYGIPEPDSAAARIELSDLDLVVVPLVGWDRQGGRLGMGGGYYDRTLSAGPRPTVIGLAYAAQEVELVPMASWDVPLDYVLTERELVTVASAGNC
jgi:5-formyltetrahydrofolate cyclo-ligase